ncbi:hypothetical protein VTI74DRAFT_8800 [Chaetomium olivicolor]
MIKKRSIQECGKSIEIFPEDLPICPCRGCQGGSVDASGLPGWLGISITLRYPGRFGEVTFFQAGKGVFNLGGSQSQENWSIFSMSNSCSDSGDVSASPSDRTHIRNHHLHRLECGSLAAPPLLIWPPPHQQPSRRPCSLATYHQSNAR